MKNISITPLGTVSPFCKDNMNLPCFLIDDGESKILLDCGNGCSKLLNIPNDLENLHIFISHYHIDHYGELGILQYASYVCHNIGILNEPINIYLPINDYRCTKKYILSNKETYSNYYFISENDKYKIGEAEISFYDNGSHSIESYMIKLVYNDIKIVYTSDIGTSNFDELVDFCFNSDLIICESSFLRKHNSKSNSHFTAYDAGMLAKCSNSKMLLLTHFWPLIDKKLYLEEAKLIFDNTKIAEEGVKLVLGGINK